MNSWFFSSQAAHPLTELREDQCERLSLSLTIHCAKGFPNKMSIWQSSSVSEEMS